MNKKVINLNTNLMISMYVELFGKNLDEFEMSASVVNKIRSALLVLKYRSPS